MKLGIWFPPDGRDPRDQETVKVMDLKLTGDILAPPPEAAEEESWFIVPFDSRLSAVDRLRHIADQIEEEGKPKIKLVR